MRWTRKPCPPVGLATRISFTTALVAAAALSPHRPRRAPVPTDVPHESRSATAA
jgi:hypothetical protein